MKKIVNFLSNLEKNNNREWFLQHKQEYLDCKEQFDVFIRSFIDGIRSFDDSVGPLEAKDCTYRIYRDTRFSKDKTPYKTHFGCFVVPGGKKSGFSGYYLQIGPHDTGFPGGCMLATGDYCCEPEVLKILREDIMNDYDLFVSALREAKGFRLDVEGALKRVPRGFPHDEPYSDFLRLRSFCLLKEPGLDYMLAPNLLDRALDDFQRTLPFLRFINRAVEYAKEMR